MGSYFGRFEFFFSIKAQDWIKADNLGLAVKPDLWFFLSLGEGTIGINLPIFILKQVDTLIHRFIYNLLKLPFIHLLFDPVHQSFINKLPGDTLRMHEM